MGRRIEKIRPVPSQADSFGPDKTRLEQITDFDIDAIEEVARVKDSDPKRRIGQDHTDTVSISKEARETSEKLQKDKETKEE